MRRTVRLLAGFAIVLVAGGVAFAADRALPGDVLYHVKTGINEPVLTFVAFSADARTEAAVSQALSRLREAERLAVRKQLTAGIAKDIADVFARRSSAAIQGIDDLASENAEAGTSIAALFTATLSAHATVLKKFPTAALLLPSLGKAQTDLESTGQRTTRTLLSGRAGVEMQDAAQRAIAMAAVDIRGVEDQAGIRVQSGLHAAGGEQLQLSVASDALAAAKTKLDGKAYVEAFELALRARAQAHAARVILEASAF